MHKVTLLESRMRNSLNSDACLVLTFAPIGRKLFELLSKVFVFFEWVFPFQTIFVGLFPRWKREINWIWETFHLACQVTYYRNHCLCLKVLFYCLIGVALPWSCKYLFQFNSKIGHLLLVFLPLRCELIQINLKKKGNIIRVNPQQCHFMPTVSTRDKFLIKLDYRETSHVTAPSQGVSWLHIPLWGSVSVPERRDLNYSPSIWASCVPSCSSHLPSSSSFLRFHWGQFLDPVDVLPHWVNKRGLWSVLCPAGVNLARKPLSDVIESSAVKKGQT